MSPRPKFLTYGLQISTWFATEDVPKDVGPVLNARSSAKNTLFLPYTLSKLSPVALRHNATVPAGVLPRLLAGHKSELHQLCVQALATTYFGKTNRDDRACVQGVRLYSQALTQLRKDISTNGNSGIGLETIMSVLCLCLYENVVFSQPNAWLMHYEGAGKLLQSRGPKPWRNPDERQVLRFARYFAVSSLLQASVEEDSINSRKILSAGHQRRHCFLDQPQWESAQCLPEGEKPERIDLLYDIFAQTPGIVHDYVDLSQRSRPNSFATRFLRQRVQSVVDQSHAWLRTVPWICVPNLDYGKDNMALPEDPMDCVAIALCYAMLLCLAQPCEYLDVALFSSDSSDTNLQSDGTSATKFLALDICKFAERALQGHESANFALFLIYPLQIAWFYLQSSKSDLTHIRGLMNSVVADSHGFEIGRMRHWDEWSLDQGSHGFLF
ncbi:hypothetical protein FALBO_1721 [Fusarium albosuccineum]|uniref:Uncharacterized protein n=1 Tax=Fusarium albosuccineum TaxID=1237068 RepID=A0A8H4PLV1_9HYPO|nr:hypothetical protein FALBO_1721 [Fusarium albosuccineum]